MNPRPRLLAIALATLAACQAEPAPDDTPGARVAIAVAPLSLPGITDATYTLSVTAGSDTVWTRSITSSAYGDGGGSASYVGPCDASVGDNAVSLTVDALLGPGGTPITSWNDPGTISRTVTCAANADTPVQFDITLARAANQGFFDVAVTFDDIFCSAKLDCADALLHNADGARDTTFVVAFACTTGSGSTTELHLAPPTLSCSDGTSLAVDPTLGPGNTDESNAHVYQVASYRGREGFGGIEKCFWNTAIGVDAATFTPGGGVSCTLSAKASASSAAWADGQTPEGQLWPYVDFSVQVVSDGALVCANHPLDVDGSGVATAYAQPDARETLAFGMSCGGCSGGPCPPEEASGVPLAPLAPAGVGYSWGQDDAGTLGNGAPTGDVLTPGLLDTSGAIPEAWVAFYPGGNGQYGFACGLAPDHTAWCWGKNNNGQLGDGATTTDQESPVPVSGGLAFDSLSAGGLHACGLTPDGAAYCWGSNQYGQAGDGTSGTGPNLTPVAVSTAEIGAGDPRPTSYSSISASRDSTCGLAATPASLAGTVWCWGGGGFGTLGGGATANLSEPAPIDTSEVSPGVPRPTTWRMIDAGTYSVCGIAETPASIAGTAWCWGWNQYCMLGIGSCNGAVMPTPQAIVATGSDNGVPRPATYRSISAGGEANCAIAEADDSAWCWGYGGGGSMGDNSTANNASPGPVLDTITPVRSISASGNFVCAIVDDGHVNAGHAYCWGYNSHGATGIGSTTTPIRTPRHVSGGRDLVWLEVNAYGAFAIEAP